MTSVYLEADFRRVLSTRTIDADEAVAVVQRCLSYLEEEGIVPGGGTVEDLRGYLDDRLSSGDGLAAELPLLALYYDMIEDYASSTYLLSLMNSVGVLETIAERAEDWSGREFRARIMEGVQIPPPGSRPEDHPQAVRAMIGNMRAELPPKSCHKLLAGNNHRIPPEAFQAKKERFLAAPDITAFLDAERDLLLAQLDECLASGRPWHEICVTDELMRMVRADPSMGSGMREGDFIIHTKVPFDAASLVRESDKTMRSFYACHCPLVRTSIRDGDPVPADFCHCSAGFTALAYEAVFGEKVEVEVLESALGGSERCRFAITIPDRFL
jgi:hypothetical protein